MKTRFEIEQDLAKTVINALEFSIEKCNTASLLVSGGSTPVELFKKLSTFNIAWDKITISLVDERIVAKNREESNENLVRKHLLQNLAEKAKFIPLVVEEKNTDVNIQKVTPIIKAIKKPFTVVVLGMGGDGHTASLFPESPQLSEGMSLENTSELIKTNPVTAPFQRISLTRKAILNTDNLFLHFYGDDKKEVFEQAKKQKDYSPFPIGGFIHQNITPLQVFWTK